MKVLVACEESGIVREAFRSLGHDAFSCDLQESSIPSPYHFQWDVRPILKVCKWDLIIAHPPCTRLANSGVQWLKRRGLWRELDEAREFFQLFLDAPCEKICIENPIPHKYAKLPKYSQIIQPWMFGHGEMKATCLWLKGLPLLTPTNIVSGREQKIWRMGPSKDRAKLRSKTYPGIAEAMALQWGK